MITLALFTALAWATACPGPLEEMPDDGPTLARIEAHVDEMDFGDVLAGDLVERTLAVDSAGEAPLYLEQVVVQGSTSFSVDTSELQRELPPGTGTTVIVRYAPDRHEPDEAALHLHSNDPFEPDLQVQLAGNGNAARIELSPTSVEFDDVAVGCGAEQEIQIRNTGALPLELVELVFEATSDELSLGEGFGPGAILEPEDWTSITVHYQATDTYPDTAVLDVISSDPARPEARAMVLADAHLGERWTEQFEGRAERGADVLWVVDNSASMYDEQSMLALNFASFLGTFEATADVDWRMAVATTDSPYYQGAVPIMDPSTPDLAAMFADAVNLGTSGSGTEQGMANALEALTPPLASPGGPNDGFLRDDATLHVIFVSDEEDQSPDTVTAYVQGLQAVKDDPDQVVISGITGGPTGCSGAGGNAYQTDRYVQAIAMTGGHSGLICDANWGSTMTELAWTSGLLYDTFELDLDPVTTTIEVTQDGDPIPYGWAYDPELNAVVFEPYAVPGDGVTVTITYARWGVCDD